MGWYWPGLVCPDWTGGELNGAREVISAGGHGWLCSPCTERWAWNACLPLVMAVAASLVARAGSGQVFKVEKCMRREKFPLVPSKQEKKKKGTDAG